MFWTSMLAVVALTEICPASAQQADQRGRSVSPFVGLWVDERGFQVHRALEIWEEDEGRPVAQYHILEYWPDAGLAMEVTAVGPGRLEMREVDGQEGSATRLVAQLGGDTLRVQEQQSGRRPIAVTLRRRDALWVRMQSDFRDMDHDGEGEGYSRRAFVRLRRMVEELRAGIRSAGQEALLDDRQEVECLYESEIVTRFFGDGDAPRVSLRQVGAALGRAAARTGSLCGALDELDEVEALAECRVVEITDPDGATTVRAQPRSASDALGTIPAGQQREVLEVRGRWLRVAGQPSGWVFAANVLCVER